MRQNCFIQHWRDVAPQDPYIAEKWRSNGRILLARRIFSCCGMILFTFSKTGPSFSIVHFTPKLIPKRKNPWFGSLHLNFLRILYDQFLIVHNQYWDKRHRRVYHYQQKTFIFSDSTDLNHTLYRMHCTIIDTYSTRLKSLSFSQHSFITKFADIIRIGIYSSYFHFKMKYEHIEQIQSREIRGKKLRWNPWSFRWYVRKRIQQFFYPPIDLM